MNTAFAKRLLIEDAYYACWARHVKTGTLGSLHLANAMLVLYLSVRLPEFAVQGA